MTTKEKFLNNVITELKDIDGDIRQKIIDTLSIQLNDYDLTEKCTDLSIVKPDYETYLKRYIATKQIEGLSINSLKRYYDINIRLLRFLNKPINEISTFDIRYYMAYLRKTKSVSNVTLDGMRRCYRSFFSWLYNENLIQSNPCASLSQIKCKKTIKKPFSAVDVEKLRVACSSKRELALIDFLYSTGCRVSEVSSVDITDIDFDMNEIKILGKGNKERIVYLTDVAMLHLKEYLQERADFSNALFVGKGGNRLHKSGISAILKNIANKAHVLNVHPHRFRRTLATDLLNRGMNIQDVAAILGHSDLKTTQIYCYIDQNNVHMAYTKYAA